VLKINITVGARGSLKQIQNPGETYSPWGHEFEIQRQDPRSHGGKNSSLIRHHPQTLSHLYCEWALSSRVGSKVVGNCPGKLQARQNNIISAKNSLASLMGYNQKEYPLKTNRTHEIVISVCVGFMFAPLHYEHGTISIQWLSSQIVSGAGDRMGSQSMRLCRLYIF